MHKGYDRELKNLTEAWNKQDRRMSKVTESVSGKDLIDDFEFGTLEDALRELPKTSVTTGADESMVYEDDGLDGMDPMWVAEKVGNQANTYEEFGELFDLYFEDHPEYPKYHEIAISIFQGRNTYAEDASDDIQKDLSFDVVDPKDLKGKQDNKGMAAQTTRLVHNSTVKGLVDEEGGEWDLDKLASILTQRPKDLLSQNGKMKKSGGDKRLFFDLSLPAYHGLFVDEKQGVFKLVKTCPSAGACKAFCYATKGGYIQYPGSSVKTGRNLNYLLNDPEGFKNQMTAEIAKLHKRAAKKGLKLSIRWHDSGDFFNEYYTDLAFAVAAATPEVDHYAYTKQVPMMKGKDGHNPPNFIFNYSQGGLHDKQIQPEDKQSIVIPKKLFAGLDVNNPEDVEKLKHNIAFKYKLDDTNVITYKELMSTPEGAEPKWHVIIDPKSGDDSAVRKDVISTLLLIH